MNIALDGPAGAGKSTLAKELAKALNIHYLDTGAMYRALAYKVLSMGKDPSKREDVEEFLSTQITVAFMDGEQHVFADGEDVTQHIRTPQVSNGASAIAVFPQVRVKLVETQRKVADAYDLVMDGRDIGTYVLPQCKNKFFITANSYERAKRRLSDLQSAGIETDLEALEKEIIARDETDSKREFAPLRCCEDAILVDTTHMSIDEALRYILDKIEE